MANKTERPGTAKDSDELIPTNAERLLLWRRANELTQMLGAAKLGTSLFNYKLMEYGKYEIPTSFIKELPKVLKPHEKCLLYRRRCKMGQLDVARQMGICRNWMRLKETGKIPCDDLLSFWES